MGSTSLGLSIALCFNRLPEDYFNSLSLDQWLEIYNDKNVPLGHKLKNLAAEKAVEVAQTLEDWAKLYNRLPSKSHIAQKKISEMKLSFEQCLWLNDNSCFGSTTKDLSLRRMSELAETLEQWIEVQKRAFSGTKIEQYAFGKLLELSSSILISQSTP